jgi:hypothetical protein
MKTFIYSLKSREFNSNNSIERKHRIVNSIICQSVKIESDLQLDESLNYIFNYLGDTHCTWSMLVNDCLQIHQSIFAHHRKVLHDLNNQPNYINRSHLFTFIKPRSNISVTESCRKTPQIAGIWKQYFSRKLSGFFRVNSCQLPVLFTRNRLGMQRFKLLTAWSYAVSRSKTITGLREKRFNDNRSKRKSG